MTPEPTEPPESPATPALDEPDELRRLLHSAVLGIEPSDAALERLKAAVPVRRARKRQALVGVAAAALLLGTGIPAAVHVAGAPGGDEHPAMAGSSQDATKDGPVGGDVDGERHKSAGDGHKKGSGHPGGSKSPGGHKGGAKSPGTGSSAPTSSAALAAAPVCAAAQLGKATADAGAPTADGKVYGTFRVENVSEEGCAVKSPGMVQVAASGVAARSVIPVVEHHEGDAAGALPAPSKAVTAMVLAPGASYEVRFAWVPAASCAGEPSTDPGEGGDGGGDPGTPGGGETEKPPVDPTTPPAGSGGSGDATSPVNGSGAGTPKSGTSDTGTTGTTLTTTQFVSTGLIREDDGAGGSIALTHTTLPGGPTAGTTIPDACGGTVYRTEMLPTGQAG